MLAEKLQGIRLILGSNSPRRKKFFKDLDLPFIKMTREVEEIFPEGLKGVKITDYLVKLKAEPFLNDLQTNDILFTCDTIVWLNNSMMGKPKNEEEAYKMLYALSGNTHQVISSICFTNPSFQKINNCITEVIFKKLSNSEIDYYVSQFKPFDKAGAYGIQEWIGMIGIEKIEGSYENVVGLPTHLFYQTLTSILEDEF